MKLSEALWQDDERMSGAVCFRHSRVPVELVFDFLANGTMDEFYERYPNVKPEGAPRRGRRVEGADRGRVPGCFLRVLLDNCARRDLKPRFDVLVTVDKNMRFQSNLRGMRLRAAVLDVKGNALPNSSRRQLPRRRNSHVAEAPSPPKRAAFGDEGVAATL